MRISELIKTVFINIFSNKSKCALTSLGIAAGSATIVLVIAIGQGGKADVADQFKNLNAGAIEVTAGQTADTMMEGMMENFGGSAARRRVVLRQAEICLISAVCPTLAVQAASRQAAVCQASEAAEVPRVGVPQADFQVQPEQEP